MNGSIEKLQTQECYNGSIQPNLYLVSSNSNQHMSFVNLRLLNLKPSNSLHLDYGSKGLLIIRVLEMKSIKCYLWIMVQMDPWK